MFGSGDPDVGASEASDYEVAGLSRVGPWRFRVGEVVGRKDVPERQMQAVALDYSRSWAAGVEVRWWVALESARWPGRVKRAGPLRSLSRSPPLDSLQPFPVYLPKLAPSQG